jgi:hypothetical protein
MQGAGGNGERSGQDGGTEKAQPARKQWDGQGCFALLLARLGETMGTRGAGAGGRSVPTERGGRGLSLPPLLCPYLPIGTNVVL